MAVNGVANSLKFLFCSSVRIYPPIGLVAEGAMAGIVEPWFCQVLHRKATSAERAFAGNKVVESHEKDTRLLSLSIRVIARIDESRLLSH